MGGSWKPYLLHPRHLGLELGLTVDIDQLKLFYEDRETEGGHAGDTRGFRITHGDIGYGFEVPCY